MVPPLIALEEHFDSGILNVTDELHANLPARLQEPLDDLGDKRIQALDSGGILVQVISHIGTEAPVKGCIAANDKLAAACQKYPNRFKGWATLPMQEPQAAADELTRTVKEHSFVGALVNNSTEDGSMYDDEKFWPVFERAVELDVPVYIHPTYPNDDFSPHYAGNFSTMAKVMMSASGWGWHSECGLHILRLFASGLFDRFPTLKIVIGHMGELLPYMLDRICHAARNWGQFKRDLRTVFRESIWITTSGMFTLPPFECLLKVSSPNRIMYSVDYPFSTTETGLQFVEEIEKAGILSKEDLDKFAYKNAEALLKIQISK